MRGGFPSTVWSLVATALAAWWGVRWLGGYHWLGPLVLGGAAVTLLVSAVWVRLVRPASPGPWLRWVARRTGDAPPAPRTVRRLLEAPADYADAAARLRRVVFGHDAAAGLWMRRLQEGASLARRRGAADRRPLASLVLAGPSGVGKRHLASVAGRMLYGDARVLVVDCQRATPGGLVGAPDAPGPLAEALASFPGQTVVFDAVERGGAELWDWLRLGLAEGEWDVRRSVSLRHAVVALVASGDAVEVPPSASRETIDQRVAEATGLPLALLGAASEVMVLEELGDEARGRVAAQLVRREARRHGVEVTRVAPEVVAGLVGDARAGFSQVAARVERLLREPLAGCVAANHARLALEVNWESPVELPGR